MDISLLEPSTVFGSTNMLKFVKNSSYQELCNRHIDNRSHRFNTAMTKSINALDGILEQLERKGILYSYYDESIKWKLYFLTDKRSKSEQKVNPLPSQKIENQIDDSIEDSFFEGFKSKKYVTASRYLNTMRSAIRRNLEFDLDLIDIENLISETKCFYTGKIFTEEDPMTIDRISNKKGYVKGNVVACSNSANVLKNELLECAKSSFKDIKDLKRFVDNIFVAMSDSSNPLEELIIFNEQ